MQPIFKEMIKMWKDLGVDLPISEGVYWYDRGNVKVFLKENCELVTLYKTTINDDLTITSKLHKDYKKYKDKEFETWQDTIIRHKDKLDELENKSISLLKKYGQDTDRLIIDTNSTGKDSEVKTYLAHKAGLKFDTYFNVTTLDVAESNKFAKSKGYKFTYPHKRYSGFYQWIKKSNLIPTRLNRACCKYYKENATRDSFDGDKKILFLFGMRNDESSSRLSYGDEWINDKWASRDWLGILPIREWTDLDIWLYTFKENIDINQKYRMGYSRVGCGIACPNYTKSTWILDKYWYPTLYNRWREILKQDFISNNKWLIMNCTLDEYMHICWNGGVYRNEPTEEVVKEYAEYNDLDIDIAIKYFNRYCRNGCLNKRKQPLKIKDKDTLAMNMKLYGRYIEQFKCKKCLLKELNFTKEQWDSKVEEFKYQGCKLF